MRRLLDDLTDLALLDDLAMAQHHDAVRPLGRDGKVAAIAAFVLRLSGESVASIALADETISGRAAAFPFYFAGWAPLNVGAGDETSIADFSRQIAETVAKTRRKGGHLSDLSRRFPALADTRLTIGLVEGSEPAKAELPDGCALASSSLV